MDARVIAVIVVVAVIVIALLFMTTGGLFGRPVTTINTTPYTTSPALAPSPSTGTSTNTTAQPTSTTASYGYIVSFTRPQDLFNILPHAKITINHSGEVATIEYTVLGIEDRNNKSCYKLELKAIIQNKTYNTTLWISRDTGDPIDYVVYCNGERMKSREEKIFVEYTLKPWLLYVLEPALSIASFDLKWGPSGEIVGRKVEIIKQENITYSLGGKEYNAYMVKLKPKHQKNIKEATYVFVELAPGKWFFVEATIAYTDGSILSITISEATIASS